MGEAKHTPGPYRVESGAVWAEAKDGSNLKISTVHAVHGHVSMGERAANAKLFAAAPDLLAFVRLQAEETVCICNFKALGYTDQPCIHCDAKKLIAKAEGR